MPTVLITPATVKGTDYSGYNVVLTWPTGGTSSPGRLLSWEDAIEWVKKNGNKNNSW